MAGICAALLPGEGKSKASRLCLRCSCLQVVVLMTHLGDGVPDHPDSPSSELGPQVTGLQCQAVLGPLSTVPRLIRQPGHHPQSVLLRAGRLDLPFPPACIPS